MKIKKITPQIAALYLGQKCVSTFITNIGVWKVGDIFNGKVTGETIAALYNDEILVELHLRRLDSITEDEARDIYKIRGGISWEVAYGALGNGYDCLNNFWLDDTECYKEESELSIGKPAAWLYLLSKGFDLFNLIDSGLAKEIPRS